MSDTFGFGAMVQAGEDFTKFIIGTGGNNSGSQITNGNQDSSTHYSTSGHQSSSTVDELQKWIDETTTSSTKTGSSTTTNSSTRTVASAAADVLASLRGLASTAISNSDNPEKTTGLIQGILQNAGDAMSAVFGKQKQSGIYNSSATEVMNNDIMSRAAADAASAVLGYQVSQQNIAGNALDALVKATATSQTDMFGRTDTTTTSDTTTHNTGYDRSIQETSAVQDARSATDSKSAIDTSGVASSSSKSRSGGLVSVVCTWMYTNNYMTSRRYCVITADFLQKPFYQQKGYRVVGALFYQYLEHTKATTLFSKFILWLFSARTEYVCAIKGLRECKKTSAGWIARTIVAILCTPTSLFFLIKEKLLGQTLLMEYD